MILSLTGFDFVAPQIPLGAPRLWVTFGSTSDFPLIDADGKSARKSALGPPGAERQQDHEAKGKQRTAGVGAGAKAAGAADGGGGGQ